MNVSLFLGIVAFMAVIYLWIGQRASRGVESTDDYYLMGRKLSFLPLCLTLLATQLGGGTLLGAAQEAYQNGWVVLLYPLGTCLGFVVLGLGCGAKMRAYQIQTVAEIFEKVYQSPMKRKLASVISIATLFFILVAQGVAAKLFLVAIGIDQPWVFICIWAVLVTYTVIGGLKAVVYTDVLQGLCIITVLLLGFVSIDPAKVIAGIKISPVNAISSEQIPWFSWLFMPLLFMVIEQDMGQRCFAAKSAKGITYAAFGAGALLMICSSIAIYFGVLAREQGLQLNAGQSVLITAIERLTNPFVTTLFLVAIATAIISTADSLLCSISSNLSCDFLSFRAQSGKTQLMKAQCLTGFIGLGALWFAFFAENIVAVLMLSYELSVSILFIPIAAALLSNRPSKLGASASMIIGFLGFLGFRWFDLPLPKELLTIGIACIAYFIGQFLEVKISVLEGVEELG